MLRRSVLAKTMDAAALCGRVGPLDALASAEGVMAALVAAAGWAGAEDGRLPESRFVGRCWVDVKYVLADSACAAGVLGRVVLTENAAAEAALVGAGAVEALLRVATMPRQSGRVCLPEEGWRGAVTAAAEGLAALSQGGAGAQEALARAGLRVATGKARAGRSWAVDEGRFWGA
jgi:hypothetical protein